MDRDRPQRRHDEETEFTERVVYINRVTKVVKGGKNFSFSALVVVGDGKGKVGYGNGKAKEVPQAIRKGTEIAKRNMIYVALAGLTIPHPVVGAYGAGRVMLKPASEGTGIIAGAPVRAIMESVGVRNVLSKSLGTENPHNVVKACFEGLKRLKSPKQVADSRGKSMEEIGYGKKD